MQCLPLLESCIYISKSSPVACVLTVPAAQGHAPVYPQWTSGYWQCKNRYHNQTQVQLHTLGGAPSVLRSLSNRGALSYTITGGGGRRSWMWRAATPSGATRSPS